MLHEFTYLAPSTKADLLNHLARHGKDTKILAGGTDLLVDMRGFLQRPKFVVDIKRIKGLAHLNAGKTGLIIGPLATCADVLESKEVEKKYGVLADAVRHLASHQLRQRATIVGNIVNASPCADSALALLVLDAVVTIGAKKGPRNVKLPAFFTGVKRTVLKPTEWVEKITVPAKMAGGTGGFLKLKRIKGHDLSLVSVAMWKLKSTLRVAIGSAAPTPVLLPDFPVSATVKEVCDAALAAVNPIDDIRCSRDYRLYMIQVYIERLMKRIGLAAEIEKCR